MWRIYVCFKFCKAIVQQQSGTWNALWKCCLLVLQCGGSALIIQYVTLSFNELAKQVFFQDLAWVKN